MMRTETKPKPTLKIEMNSTSSRSRNLQRCESMKLNGAKSTKSTSDIGDEILVCKDAKRSQNKRKIQRVRQLQQQKYDLLNSIQILKASALSAIAEKDDQIQKIMLDNTYNNDQRLQLLEMELYDTKQRKEQLEKEKQQIYDYFHSQRLRFAQQLQQKQNLIQDLNAQIQQMQNQLLLLQEKNHVKSNQMKTLQQQNTELQIELQSVTLSHSLRSILRQPDLQSSIHLTDRSRFSSFHSCDFDSISNHNQEQQNSFLASRIQQLDRLHKEDVVQLRSFYQKRIESLKQIYQRELSMPHANQRQHSTLHSRSLSKSSILSSRSRRKDIKSIRQPDMCSIEESDELVEYERQKRDLKSELKITHPVEFPTSGQRLRTQPQNDNSSVNSHFTAQYFENPYQFKKNKSTDILSAKSNPHMEKRETKIYEMKFEDPQINSPYQFLDKTTSFVAGVLSGVIITAAWSGLWAKTRNF